jgi:phage shock protein PspC (stress-responsive transcriptional regulator)
MTDHLYRSRDDRMLAGVAGGLAERWGADPSIVRLVWALLVVFTGGIALVVYIVMAIVVPEGDDELPRWTTAPPSALPGSVASPMASPAASPAPTAAGPGPEPTGAPTPSASAPVSYWVPSGHDARAERRAARRAARRDGYGTTAPVLLGVCLVMLGGFFLARDWLPDLDWNWFWPLMLIGIGVLLLVMAMGRRPTDPGAPS